MARSFFASTFVAFAVAGFSPDLSQAAQGDRLYIEVGSTKLRAQPKHWAPSISELTYGDKLVEVSLANGWYRVTGEKGEGFVHESAVTERKVKLRSGGIDPDIRPDESDIVLAGKGFNKEVEASYAKTEASLNYESVNRVEAAEVSDKELLAFLRDGRLNVE